MNKTGVSLLIALASLAGAGSAQEAEPGDDTPPADDDASMSEMCFDVTRVQDVNVFDDQHVYVGTIGGNHYLLTMEQPCQNLQRSYRSGGVRIQPYGRRVCQNDGSHLLYDWFGRESVCPILSIEPVDDRAQARAIAESGRSPVEVEEVSPPE